MPQTDPGMAGDVQWEADFALGHALVDAQHQALLTQCKQLAEHCAGNGSEAQDQAFDQAFERLKVLAREHFETEASLLAACSSPELEDHHIEREEFEYLCDEIVTTENFDRAELQRFLALWCVGHIKGSVSTAWRGLHPQDAGSA